jgi:type I restriction enzyme, S subunit
MLDGEVIAIKQSTAQRQNIPHGTFSGQLVPQGPSDEPPAELLARIRALLAVQASSRKVSGRQAQEVA